MENIKLNQEILNYCFNNIYYSTERWKDISNNNFEFVKARLVAELNEKAALKIASILVKYYNDYYYSLSRCASSAITGGSNFNVARAIKRRDSSDKKYNKCLEIETKLVKKYKKILFPELFPKNINKGDQDIIERLEAKLIEAKKHHQALKADKSLRGHSYSLTYANKAVKDLEKRIEATKRFKSNENKEIVKDDCKIIVNYEINRVQIFHNTKPDREVISNLKKSGFRWTPSIKAWQAYINNNSLRFLELS